MSFARGKAESNAFCETTAAPSSGTIFGGS